MSRPAAPPSPVMQALRALEAEALALEKREAARRKRAEKNPAPKRKAGAKASR